MATDETSGTGGTGTRAGSAGTAGTAGTAGRRTFPGISSRAFEHPADRTALTALRSLQGFDTALRRVSGLVGERSLRLMHLGSAVRVGPKQFRHVHAILTEAAAVLDLPAVPEVYVVNDPRVSAFTLGLDKPFVVISTGTVDLMTTDELRFVVGHELGHVASGHAVYRTLLYHLIRVAQRVAWIPLGVLGVRAVVTALEEWARKSELSADRAGLLVTQDEQAALRALMKIAGGARIADMDVDAFLEQAAEYDASGDVRDSVLKLLSLQGQTHPFAVLRAAELRRWFEQGEYAQVVAGAYPRREDDPSTSIRDEVREATRSYGESMRESADPLVTLVRDAAGKSQRWWQRRTAETRVWAEASDAPDDDTVRPTTAVVRRPQPRTATPPKPAPTPSAGPRPATSTPRRSPAPAKATAKKAAAPAKKTAPATAKKTSTPANSSATSAPAKASAKKASATKTSATKTAAKKTAAKKTASPEA